MLAGKATHATRPVMANAAVTSRVHSLPCIDNRSVACTVTDNSPHSGSTIARVLYRLVFHVCFPFLCPVSAPKTYCCLDPSLGVEVLGSALSMA